VAQNTKSPTLVEYQDNLIVIPKRFSDQWLTALLERMTNPSQKKLFAEQTKIITRAVLETMASLNNDEMRIFPNIVQGGEGCYAVAPGRVREETEGTFHIGIPVDSECKNFLFVAKNNQAPIAIGHLIMPGNKNADWLPVRQTIAEKYKINKNKVRLDFENEGLNDLNITAEMGRVSPVIQPLLYTGDLPYHVLIDTDLKSKKIWNNLGNIFVSICTTTEEIVRILESREILINEGNFSKKGDDVYSPDTPIVFPEYTFARWSKEDGIVF
jgi:hypothetical protein